MIFDEKIYDYCNDYSYPLPEYISQLERETGLNTVNPFMSCGPVMGRYLIQMSQWIRPDRIIEIGSFTGYSALCLSEGLSKEGMITCIEVNEEYESYIRKYFEKAKKAHQLNLLIGDGLHLLDTIHETFDLAYIDANKQHNATAYDKLIPRMRTGGTIIVDNVLWYGNVLQAKMDKESQAIQSFNLKIKNDARVKSFILPLRDGVMVIEKL